MHTCGSNQEVKHYNIPVALKEYRKFHNLCADLIFVQVLTKEYIQLYGLDYVKSGLNGKFLT